ncbi:FAD:protein FMN transferase [Thiofaba sp. EF100]|uniref:FAD:protein FMN transferase n=1 Tax=Thiofaba sp. EF100 TaxID=3121274 RepID=UPI003221604A
MHQPRRTFLGLLTLSALAPLAGCSREPRIQTEGFLLYGMLTQLSLPDTAPIAMTAALGELEAIFKREYAVLHPWQDSPLTRLNAALASGDWTPLDARLRGIIERGRELEAASGGAFSPAVGALVKLWGFHSSQPNQEREPPPQAEIDRLMTPPPRMSDLEIDGDRIRCRNTHVLLDFNAMAEGWAAELAAQRLAELGVRDALIDASGDLLVRGQAGHRPWRVAIQDPFTEGPLGWLDIRGDLAVFTSGSYRKRFTHKGVSYNHIIDPRSGWPSRGVVGATVIAQDALLANAAATGLLATGLADAPALIQRMGLDRVLLVDEHGTLHATPSMADALRLARNDRPLRILQHRA